MRNFSLFNHQLLQIYDFGTVLVKPKCGHRKDFFLMVCMKPIKRGIVLKDLKPGILDS